MKCKSTLRGSYNKVHVYGAYNTGTNWIKSFLEENFVMTVHSRGKHILSEAKLTLMTPSGRFAKVIIVKDPFFWAISCAKAPYHGLMPRKSMKNPGIGRRPVRIQGRKYRNIGVLWREYTNIQLSQTGFFSRDSIVIRYEDLLHDPEKIRLLLAEHFPSLDGPVVVPTKAAKSHGKSRNTNSARKWYTEDNRKRLAKKHTKLYKTVRRACKESAELLGYDDWQRTF